MPNIEVHGLGRIANRGYHTGLEKDIPGTLKKLRDILSATEFRNEVVITVFDSYCIDVKAIYQPFLRICDTDIKRAEKITKIIRGSSFNLDIEIVRLERFFAKKRK